MTNVLLCLSVRQPWAWLIVQGWKLIENRTWPTSFRGRFLVHASKGLTAAEYESCYLFVAGFAPACAQAIPEFEILERGGIVGEATLLDCVTRHDSEWFCGPYGFVLEDAKPWTFYPCRGALGFFPLPSRGPSTQPVTVSETGISASDEVRQRELLRDAHLTLGLDHPVTLGYSQSCAAHRIATSRIAVH